jgi:low temperature requirement protein LtrA
MRERAGPQRVTNVELFFDLVYVFAVTQLSHFLLAGPGTGGAVRTALEAALLLIMVWLLWAYTTWVTNWLDPDRLAVRLLLLVLAVISLVMSAAIPTAFSHSGLLVGGAYLVMQVGRSTFAVRSLADKGLRRNFQRILAWCVVSGLLALAGGLVHDDARLLLWAGAVAVDVLGSTVGFYTPGLGRSKTADWTIEGGHFAERCQGFILIAIGESIVVIGATLAARLTSSTPLTGSEIAAFLIAVVGSVAFWWLYFDRTARDASEVIAHSADPGRLGRSAYHDIHPVMVAGIIVAAAGDGATAEAAARSGASGTVSAWVAWLVLGGPALFLAGHAAFKAVVWKRLSWPRIGAVVVLALLGLLAPHVSALVLSACSVAVVVAVAVADQLWPPPADDQQRRPDAASSPALQATASARRCCYSDSVGPAMLPAPPLQPQRRADAAVSGTGSLTGGPGRRPSRCDA